MAVSRAMRRLLHVREIEEKHCRTALDSALGNLKRLQGGLAAAYKRERQGRRLVTASATTGDLVDRVAGLEETGTARRHAAALGARIAEAEHSVVLRQQDWLAKRVERRQVEAVIKRAEEVEAVEARRRAQRDLDDGFLRRSR